MGQAGAQAGVAGYAQTARLQRLPARLHSVSLGDRGRRNAPIFILLTWHFFSFFPPGQWHCSYHQIGEVCGFFLTIHDDDDDDYYYMSPSIARVSIPSDANCVCRPDDNCDLRGSVTGCKEPCIWPFDLHNQIQFKTGGKYNNTSFCRLSNSRVCTGTHGNDLRPPNQSMFYFYVCSHRARWCRQTNKQTNKQKTNNKSPTLTHSCSSRYY